MENVLNGEEVNGMVSHWLSVPVNGYLGSDYGSDLLSLLQTPMASGMADEFIDKMLDDLPLIGALPSGAVNVHMEEVPGSKERQRLLIEVAGRTISVENIDRDRIAR